MRLTTAMLADAAHVADGKLYVHGGGWDNISAATFPVVHPTMALVVVFRVEWNETNEPFPFAIELFHEDGGDPLVHGEGMLEAGRPPGKKHGAPIFMPQQLTFQGLQFAQPGGYYFRVVVRGEELATVPFTVADLATTTPPLSS